MPIELDDRERAALAEAGLAVFEDRIILHAQPPATDDALGEIAKHCAGELPSDLIALWRVAFGGALDYDLRREIGGRDTALSFCELFYPASRSDHGLWGWIDHEERLARDRADERGERWSGRLSALPIGGFEHLDRIYVVTAAEDHGSVWASREGRPGWAFEAPSDSIARIAASVRGVFGALALERDPWAEAERGGAGRELRLAIDGLASRSAADALRALVRSTVLDWRAALEDGTITGRTTHRRLALQHAAQHGDVEVLERLASLGCDLREQVRGGTSALEFALCCGSHRAARWLLDRGLPVESALKRGVSRVDLELARELIARGAIVDEETVFLALAGGDLEVALFLVDTVGLEARSLGVAIRARRRAREALQLARRIEGGEVASDVSPAVWRARAARLREIADRIDPTVARG